MIGSALPVLARNAEAGAGVSLRVEIDEQDFFADRRQSRRQIDGSRGFSDPAFLIGDGDYSSCGV